MKDIKLLLVDDEIEFREATSAALSRRGFTVVMAQNGERALEMLDPEQPDIIILDLRMDGLSGLETLEVIRKRKNNVPVIILTGHGQLDDAVAGIQLGIVDFWQKPVDVDRLATQIRRLLSKGQQGPLAEKKVGALALSIVTYPRIRDDATISELIPLLRDSVFKSVGGKVTEQGHRTVLVYDRHNKFVGCLRIGDILAFLLPAMLRGSPYASYLTGMFAGQCKMVATRKVREFIVEQPSLDVDAPLMEAVNLMVTHQLINLPIFMDGELVGILRDKDLLAEASNYFA